MAATPLPAQPSAPTSAPPATPDFSGASFDSLIRMAAKGLASEESVVSQLKDSAQAAQDVGRSIADIKIPDPPKPPDLPPPPKPQFHSPMDEFGSIASTLAIFGSLLTRHPLTSALNASAAAMKAIQQGDYQSYQMNMDNWKTQTDYALKQADQQNKYYQSILDNKTFTINQKTSALNAYAKGTDDLVAGTRLLTEGYDGFAKLLMDRTRLQIAINRAAQGVRGKWSPANEAYLSYVQEGIDALHLPPGQQPTPQQMAKIQTEAYQQLKAASAPGGATTARQQKAVNTADQLIAKLQKNLDEPATLGLGVTGLGGIIGSATETFKTLFPSNKKIPLPVTTFRQNLQTLQAILPAVLTGSGRSNADVRALIEQIAPGLEWDSTVDKTRRSLKLLSETMPDFSNQGAASPDATDQTDSGSPQDDPLGLFGDGGN